MKLYVVSYDIPADREGNLRRRHIQKFLEGHGARVMYSVFEIRVKDAEELEEIVETLGTKIHKKTDKVRIYPIFPSEEKDIIILGSGNIFDVEPYTII